MFHDDQHGTAIIAAAGLINACEITKRKLSDIKVVVNGAGAAGLSVSGLIKLMGVKSENVILCDSQGRDLSRPAKASISSRPPTPSIPTRARLKTR